MQNLIQNFGREELVLLTLRRLFEQRGFCRVKTGKFEEYALYIENKNFLDTDSIITFMDVDGKLLALKPDVTLSIIKNMPRKPVPVAQKLYYIDEVYRFSPENREYKVHNQIGIEYIGKADGNSNLEVVDLALESLRAIGESFALDISHLGFVSGLLAELGVCHRNERKIFENIHTKNTWDISQLLQQSEVPEEQINRVMCLASLHGDFASSLKTAKSLICNDAMQTAFDELQELGQVLQVNGDGGSVNLDFSAVSHLDYYNGLIFRGYVQGVPSVVLTGGRYDNLMKKMRKQSSAIGFAVALDELGTYLERERQHDFDWLVTYSPASDFSALLALVKQESKNGRRIRIEREENDITDFSYAQHLRFVNGKLEEVSAC